MKIKKCATHMGIAKFIEPTKLDNTDGNQMHGNKDFQTEDFIYLDSWYEVENLSDDERITYPTDYAVMNYALISEFNRGPKDRQSCWTWLRTAYLPDIVNGLDTDGFRDCDDFVDATQCGIPLATHLNLSSVISARSALRDFFRISEIKTKDSGKYHTIEFGEYPKTYVGKDKNKELEALYSSRRICSTGKTYTGFWDGISGICVKNEEFEYEGQKYVRVLTKRFDDDSQYCDGTIAPEDGTYMWVKVEPIVWKIRNWGELPKEINPNGNGKAEYMDVRTEEAIISGIPFYPDSNDENCSMWQNSMIRAYFNGYNLHNEIDRGNGNSAFKAPHNFDFTKHNFLTEAFDDLEFLQTVDNKQEKKYSKKRESYGIKIAQTPMAIDEQISFYIKSGISFMLHGPSGVGKTRRIQESDPDFVSIVLRNGMLPEEIIGKTIYPNNDKTQSGIWIPPTWYQDLCKKCKEQPDKNHVLFIDEITNVKPTEQSLVFHLILSRSIGPNLGKLPDNVVVVAAGNNKEESESAYDMPEPLFRRFSAHIYLKPDIKEWVKWGSEMVGDRYKIHPLVSAFVAASGMKAFYSTYDSENPPEYAIDPRGWEQISDILYDNDGVIFAELVENKIGKSMARAFVNFAQNPPLSLQDIMEDNFQPNDIPKSFDGKYALAVSLRSADFDQVAKVREFVGQYLGSENLAAFDSIWVDKDNEKAIYLKNLKQKQNSTKEKIQQ